MKCINCGYALWNLRVPRCPECGMVFDVRGWQFEPGSVHFACSSCEAVLDEQSIGGGWTACQSCGRKLRWSEVRVVPLEENTIARRRDALTLQQVMSAGTVLLPIIGMVAAFVVIPHQVGSNSMYPVPLAPLFLSIGFWLGGFGIHAFNLKRRRSYTAMICWLSFAMLVGAFLYVPKFLQRSAYIEHHWICSRDIAFSRSPEQFKNTLLRMGAIRQAQFQ